MGSLVVQPEAQDSQFQFMELFSRFLSAPGALPEFRIGLFLPLGIYFNLVFEIVTAPSKACRDLYITSQVLSKRMEELWASFGICHISFRWWKYLINP